MYQKSKNNFINSRYIFQDTLHLKVAVHVSQSLRIMQTRVQRTCPVLILVNETKYNIPLIRRHVV